MDERILTLGDVLARDAAVFPDRTALVQGETSFTWSQLNARVNEFANGLLKLGVSRGDKVGLWMPNNVEWVIGWFGISKVGAIVIPLDTWYKPSEAEYILAHSDSVACVMVDRFGSTDYIEVMKDIRPNLPQLRNVIVVGEPGEGHMGFGSVMELGKDWLGDQHFAQRLREPGIEDVAFILYTSGTTGKPKGAMLTHHNIIQNAHDIGDVLETTFRDALLIPVPFSHCFGNVVAITLCAAFGVEMVPMLAFDPEKALQMVEEHKVSVLYGVPTMFIRELEVLKRKHYDVSSLRTGIMAGAPCPVDTMEDVVNIMGCNTCILYGLTETSPGATMTRLDDDIRHRVETVGRPLPEVEVRIVDDERRLLSPGEVGELAIRGYNVMKGYYKMEEATDNSIDQDGWLYTGDLGVMDPDGYFRITGRKKDMIIVGGVNVYPREIEEYLISHPSIREVAVVGVPDHDLGEVVGAAVIPENGSGLTAQEVVDFCYGTIASNKTPRFIWLSESLPISGRGKVQKFILRKQFADGIAEGNANIHKVIPTAVVTKGKAKELEPVISMLLEKGIVAEDKKGQLTHFLLSLGDEQLNGFEKLFQDPGRQAPAVQKFITDQRP